MKSSTTSGKGFQPQIPSFGSILFALLFLLPWAASAQPEAFITTWKTDNPGSSNSSSITIPIPIGGGGYNYDVDWNNDGIYDQLGLTADVVHNFGTAGTYTIRIRGSFPRIYFNGGGDCRKLLNISQWGTIAWTSMDRAFWGCSNLNISATDAPDLSGVTNTAFMFAGCTILNSPANIGNWNTGSVTTMDFMFYQASAFDQPIGSWNTAEVTSMRTMFADASSFNQPIGTWNTAKVTDMSEMFYRASSFNQPIGDWNTAAVDDMSGMFYDADAFNQPLGTWNTAKVTNMGFLFSQANSFNQPISTWNTALVTNMLVMFYNASSFNQPIGAWTLNASVDLDNMLDNCGMDCANYSSTLYSWANNPATPSGRSLGALGRQYSTNAAAARNTLTTTKGWTITGDAASGAACALPPQGDELIITVKTDNPGSTGSTSFRIPTIGAGYNYDVDWNNDGNYDETGLTSDAPHDFGTAGTYTIRIRGSFPRIFFAGSGSRQKLLDINQWGSTAWVSMERAFLGCTNLNISATDVPNLSGLTRMDQMFLTCTSLNSPANIGDWNTSNVTNMSAMFSGASLFNQPIGDWNTSAVTNMVSMFYQASAFNQPIGDWNTAAVTDMTWMFYQASAFNQPIGDWNTAAVTNMEAMFNGASAFNQPIGDWNTGAVTNMSFMFAGADMFDQPIGDWNMESVVNMQRMFLSADLFNQPIGDWNTESVTNMFEMFKQADAFNQPIGNWNTASVTNMWGMFNEASSFNQPIGDWNTASVTVMFRMFHDAIAFNQPLGNWNTAAVTDMAAMFYQATAFNQPLGTWTLNEAVKMFLMLDDCGMDCENYSATLIGWANNPTTPNGRSLEATGRTYGATAEAARTTLTTTKGWTITGDAPASVTTADAGPNDVVCSLTTTLAGNTPVIGSGSWTQVSGPGTTNFADVHAPNTGVTVSVPGAYTLRWTINAPCAASSNDVDIAFTAGPSAAYAGPDQTSNATCGQTQVTLAANAPSVGAGMWSVQSGTGGSFGNASSAISTFSGNAGATYTLRWTVTNAPCAASTDEMTVSFNQAPSFSACPPGVTVSASSGCFATATYAATAATTTPAASLAYTFGGATTGTGPGTGSGQAFNLGTTTVNLTATNTCGSSNCSFIVVVRAGEINVQGNATTIVDGDNTPSTSDHTDFGQTTGAPVVRTFTVQNTSSVALSVSGISISGPGMAQFSAGPLTPASPVAPNGSATFTVTYSSGVVGTQTATVNIQSGDCDEATYNFDVKGELTCSPPSFTACPTNLPPVNVSAGTCSAAVTYSVAANGLPTPNLTYVFTGATTGSGSSTGSGSAFSAGVTTVTVTATNPCGAPTCSFTVTVVDNQNPSIVCPSSITRSTDLNQCMAVVSYANPTFSDNCSGVALTRTGGPASGSSFPKGTTMVNWRATDAAGNSSVCNFTVTVTDGQAPSITCPASIVKSTDAGLCSAVATYATPTYSDNCTGAGLDHISGGLSGSTFAKGVSSVIWQATDGAGLTQRCTFTVTVNDGQAPAITCPGHMTRNTNPGQCVATVTYASPTASDNCTASPTVTIHSGLPSGSAFPKGVNTVVWKATDEAGLMKTCTIRVTVNDLELPSINCPANQTVYTSGSSCVSAAVNYSVTASDNCSTPAPALTRLAGPASGSTFPKGVTNVAWRATDASSNMRSCSFTVTVTDNVAPLIACPGNVAVTAAAGACSAVVTYANPTATDNCAVTSVVLLSGLASGSIFPEGATVNTFRAMDDSGLTAMCSFTVTVSCGTSSEGSEKGKVKSEKLIVKSETLAARTTDDGPLMAMNLSPNPATMEVQISIAGLGKSGGEMTVLNTQGRVVWQQRFGPESLSGEQQMTVTLDVSGEKFAAGLYFMTLRSEGQTVTKRLVVQRL